MAATYYPSYKQAYDVYGGDTSTPATPLSAPTGLAATPMAGAIGVSWNQVANASGYTLQRALVTNGVTGTYSTVYSGTATSYTDGNVVGGNIYRYRVLAQGTGAYSNSGYSTPVQVTAAPAAATQSIAYGDSRTAPASRGGFAQNWFEQIPALVNNSSVSWSPNLAVGGAYTVDHGGGSSYIGAQVQEGVSQLSQAVATHWGWLAIGVNDAQNQDALADIQAHYSTAVAQAKQGVDKLIGFTILTSRFTGFDSTRWQTIFSLVTGFNSWLRTNYQSLGIDVLVDVYSDKFLYGYDAPLNSTYWQTDQVHLTAAGSARIAAVAAKAVPLLLANQKGIVISDDPYVASNAPTISGFTPSSGAAGTSVTVAGTNLLNATAKVNVAVTTVTASSATSLTFTVPAGATTGPIFINNNGSTARSATNFTVPGTTVTPFSDDFERPDGAVGNSWVNTGTRSLSGGKLINNGAVFNNSLPMLRPTSEAGLDMVIKRTITLKGDGAVYGVLVRASGGNAYMGYFTDNPTTHDFNIFLLGNNYTAVTALNGQGGLGGLTTGSTYNLVLLASGTQLILSVETLDGTGAGPSIVANDATLTQGVIGLTDGSASTETLGVLASVIS